MSLQPYIYRIYTSDPGLLYMIRKFGLLISKRLARVCSVSLAIFSSNNFSQYPDFILEDGGFRAWQIGKNGWPKHSFA